MTNRLALLALLAIVTVSSVYCNTDSKSILKEDIFDDGEIYDYELEDESEIDAPLKQEFHQGPPPQSYPPVSSSNYGQQPANYQPVPLPIESLANSVGSYVETPVQQNYGQDSGYAQQPVAIPSYQPVQQQVPVASYPAVQQQHQQSYSAPQVVSNYSTGGSYGNQQQTGYQQPSVSSYQPVQQSTYSTPPVVSNYSTASSGYVNTQQVASNYIQPQTTSYQQQVPLPSPPIYAGGSNYSTIPVLSQPSYQPPVAQYGGSSNYSQGAQVNKYSTPVITNTIPSSVGGYQQQVPLPVYGGRNYSTAPVLQQQVAQYGGSSNHSQVSPQLARYSVAELASSIPLSGYRANHWSLFYYRSSPYRTCPKNLYLSGPTYKDIEAAFAYAQQQLAVNRGATVQYMNSTQPSWAARHQVFSFLTQLNARMDEEGLLIEFVSQFLADRACLTKWDKQRYLPQLTKLISVSQFPGTSSCSQYYNNQWQGQLKTCVQNRYRTIDGFCNNPHHPYWGKSNVCHIRLLSPDYADGISIPRNSYNPKFPLPNPRTISSYIHNDIPLEGPYNLMKMQWGQFINHDITNTALSSYDGLVDCCKNPNVRGCWPMTVPPGDRFYTAYNVTCLNFIRSGVCPLCQLGPRQQINKNTAFMDLSTVYGNTQEQAQPLRTFKLGLLRTSPGKTGEQLLPIATDKSQDQCSGSCFLAGDSRVNQHPALTVLHTLMLRNHNKHAQALYRRHPNWTDEILFQEARRINIAEYQMVTYAEYLPIVFGPILSAYYRLLPQQGGYTYYDYKVDPTTWNEYSTATCRFGHSQIQSTFGMYSRIFAYGQQDQKQPSYRLREWFMRPSLLSDGLIPQITNGLLARPSMAVDPWITTDVRNHLYQSQKEHTGGDLAATNIWRGRDHGIPGYVHYIEYCFNYKVRGWKDLSMFIPYYTITNLRKLYRVVENIDLFTGGMSERHFPGADIGPTFACVNGIQYYHLKFGDRYFFEHGNQPGSFTPSQLEEIKRTTLARLLCRTAYIPAAPQYAFLQPSNYNSLVNCSQIGDLNYNLF